MLFCCKTNKHKKKQLYVWICLIQFWTHDLEVSFVLASSPQLVFVFCPAYLNKLFQKLAARGPFVSRKVVDIGYQYQTKGLSGLDGGVFINQRWGLYIYIYIYSDIYIYIYTHTYIYVYICYWLKHFGNSLVDMRIPPLRTKSLLEWKPLKPKTYCNIIQDSLLWSTMT